MQINGFDLVNEEKIERAKHGTVTRGGKLTGGVGDEASEEALIAEYDRLGGLIVKDGVNVKIGSFYDFAKRAPRAEPVVTFMAEFEGEILEVDEEEAKSIKIAKEKTAKLKAKKVKKGKKKE